MADFIINDDGTINIFDKKKKKESDKWDIRNATLAGQSKNNSWQQGVGEKEWYEQILQKPQAFEDGYQFGDVTKTVFGTAGDILSTGAKATWQNIYDIGMNVAGANYWALDKLGIMPGAYDAFTDIERYNQDVAVVSDIDKGVNKLNEATRDNSVLGDFSKDVLQSAIQSAEMAGLSKFSKLPLWQANSLATGFRNEYVNALNNGATKEQATISGLTSGISEVLSEYLFSGFIKLPGTGSGIDTALGKATEKIGNQFLRTAAQYGINIGGEAFEEVLSGFGSALGQKLTYLKDKDFKDIYSLEDALENAGAGALSALFGSANPQTIQNIRDGRNLVTGLTSTQHKYINEIAQQRMVEAQKRNEKLGLIQKGKINQRTMTDFEKGRLADASKLQQVNLPGLSNKDMDLQQSAYKYGINPNSEFVVTTKTMLDNRGIKSRFDADAFKNINGNAYWTNNNGVREVVFNPNASEQAILEEIAIHELTHDLMSSKNSKDIIENQKIIDYVSTLDGYKESRAKLEKLYSKQTKGMNAQKANALINEEIVADTLGKNIGSQEYIRRLIDDEPSIAKNIYDWVVNKVANKNGVKNEKAYWNNVKNNFEKAYNMEYQGKGSEGGAKYSFMSEKGLTNAIKSDSNNQILADKLAQAKKLRKQGYSNEQIRQKTLWFQDPNGKWLFEISDSKVEINKLEKNKTYKLEEVLPHNELFEAYPKLRKMIIKTKDFKKGKNGETFVGQYDTVLDRIFINNELIDTDTEGIRNTILHEVQHKIQEIEGLESGSESKNLIRYYTSLGEIQSTDVEMRSRLDYSDIKKKAPEVSKEFPIHQQLQEIHKNINKKSTQKYFQKNPKVAELYNEIYNNGNEGEYDRAKINKKGTTNNISKKDEILHKIREWLRVEGNYKSLQRELENSSFSMSEQLENQANEVAKKEIAERQAMIELFEDYLSENDITNPTEQDIYNSLDPYDVYDANESFDQEGQEKYFDTIKKYLKEQNQDVRYSLTDNQGRELTKEQQEKFKDSKVRDSEGNLKVMYHGTEAMAGLPEEAWFTIFDAERAGRNGSFFGTGFYFTDNKEHAQNYAHSKGKVYETYLNIKNPYIPYQNLEDGISRTFKEDLAIRLNVNKEASSLTGEEITNILKENGYDGVINGDTVVAFYPNQIKNVDNLNPTDNADIRYSLSDNQEERISKLQEEYESWDKARDVVFDERDALRKELNELIRSEDYKNANSKFMEMVKSGLSPDEISKTPEYQLMAEEEKIRKKLKEYDEDIKVMTEDMTRITEMIENEEKSHRNPKDAIKQAKDFFGTTNDFREAGYLLQDGTLLDFSGRTQGSRTYGRRTLDHREINEVGYDMDEFIELGNIRMKPESSGFELSKPLTKEQKSIIRDYLDTLDDDIMIDITKEGKVLYDSATYKKGTSASKIFNDLDYYFENGSFPKQSKYAEFRYSLSKQNEGWQSFLDNNFEAKGTKTRLSDIKLPGLTNTIQEEVQQQTSNALLPIANELRELNKNLTKVMNPAEISQLTPQDANTTPILPGINRNQVGDGRSSFFDNINNKVNMLNDEQKAAILSSNDVKYYDKVTNKDSLDKAYARLQENGQSESLRWFNKASESADATDVAEGWILLKHYADSGDTNGMVEVAKKLRDMGTKAGQTVQAFNILSRLTPEGMVKYAQSELLEAYDNMVKNKSKAWIDANRDKFELKPNEVQFIMDTMREVSQMEDGYDKRVKLAEIQKLMTDKLPPTKGAGLKAWMRISMLFNPKTQIRNIAGNAVIAPVNYFGDLFASGVDKLISKKTGVRTTGTTKLSNYAKGFKTGLYQSYNDFKKGINTRNIEGNRFEVTEGKSFNDNNAIGKALNKVDSLLSFMLDAGDRGFYEASFVNSINNQMVLNNANEVTQEMIDIATQEALSRTWQDNNTYSKAVLGIRKLLNLGQTYGIGDVLIPFAKTPANLTKAIVDYSPAGLVNVLVKGNNLRKSLNNGQFNAKMQHEFVQSLGKATAGTMLYVLGYALAQAGITSGASDEDKDVSNFMKNTLGVNSYSIKIGDKSFTYDWAQPIAAPLTITANVVNAQKEDKEQALTEAIVGSLDSAGSTLLEQSFLQSINDVLNNQDGVVSGLITEMLELPARAIPTLSKQIVDLTDSTQRQTFEYNKPIKSAYNYAISKIPGLSYTLDPSVDTMGREIKKYGGKNNLFNVFLNPANVSTENVSESAKEIYRLYKETGETNIMPRVAPYYVNKKGEKIILTTQQRTQYQKVSGDIIEANVANLLGSTAYQNMSDTKKAETINDIVNYSYNIAQMETLGTELSETYETAYEYAQIGDISDFYEFRNSIDDTDADTKRTSIVNYLYNSDLEDNQIANLYGNYYSSDKTLNAMLELRIPMREFIKFNSADIQGQYNSKTGQTISGSKKNATIEYVNTLNLSKAQRAILVKSVYSSHKSNDNDIIRYVNTLPGTANEKKVLLKSIGFDAYDDDVFNYINSQNISKEEKIKKLKELGFTVRNGRVYY